MGGPLTVYHFGIYLSHQQRTTTRNHEQHEAHPRTLDQHPFRPDNVGGLLTIFCHSPKGEANLVAGCFGDVRGGIEVAEANARLIAAAPELLEALEALTPWVEVHSKDRMKGSVLDWNIEQALAAIAKATQP